MKQTTNKLRFRVLRNMKHKKLHGLIIEKKLDTEHS